MNLSIFKKLSFVFLLIYSYTSFSNDSVSIKSVKNLSNYKMIISSKLKCASIEPHTEKNFSSSFYIPFISIKHNLKEYVKDIPFVPLEALKLGSFYLWRNESGVVCAPDPSNPEAILAWKLKILLDKKNKKNVKLDNMVLNIDKDGNFEMNQQKDLLKG